MGVHWGYTGVTQRLHWGYTGATLGLYWGYTGVRVGPYWGWEYEWLLNHRFPSWLRKAFGPKRSTVHLVQDHERALWCDEPLAAMDANDIHLLRNYPKCSQDLNPAETAWRELRARLDETMPTKMETRGEFIARLRNAVSWLNSNRADYFMKICNSQVEWADDVKAMQGGRTKH